MRISVIRMPFENLSDFQVASLFLRVVRTLLQNISDFLIGFSFNGKVDFWSQVLRKLASVSTHSLHTRCKCIGFSEDFSFAEIAGRFCKIYWIFRPDLVSMQVGFWLFADFLPSVQIPPMLVHSIFDRDCIFLSHRFFEPLLRIHWSLIGFSFRITDRFFLDISGNWILLPSNDIQGEKLNRRMINWYYRRDSIILFNINGNLLTNFN